MFESNIWPNSATTVNESIAPTEKAAWLKIQNGCVVLTDDKSTFTNRETGEYFQASLFPKTDLGENVYELATDNKTVTAIYVNENTYREAEGDDADMQQLIVELTPAEVDPYAGFLNVDNETLVTMAFARDNNETSNKWYVAATENNLPLATSEYILNFPVSFKNIQYNTLPFAHSDSFLASAIGKFPI